VNIVRLLQNEAFPPLSALLPNTASQQGALTATGFASCMNRAVKARTVNLT